MIKSIVIIAFILIIFSLGSALYQIVTHKSQEESRNTVKALTFRIGLSIILFIFVFITIATGLYKPSGIGVQMQIKKTMQGSQLK